MISKDNNRNVFVYLLCFLWLLVPVVDFFGEKLLDVNYFAFREWEPMKAGATIGPFKSSARFEKVIYGDLANMLKVRAYRQYRHQVFTTDSYGYRSLENAGETNFPIVVLGDSDMAGSSLSDDQTFSFQLGKQLGVKVYNYADQFPTTFLADSRFEKNPPKILIWEGIELEITGGNYKRYSYRPEHEYPRVESSAQEIVPEPPMPRLSKYFSQQIFFEIRWYLTGIRPDSIGHIDPKTKMLFYSQGMELLRYNSDQRDLQSVLKGIETVKRLCEERNITLIYMPLPNKENIYRYLLPSRYQVQREGTVFLQDLHAGLSNSNIYNVDLLRHFDKISKDKYLYFLDDTHWSPDGVMEAVNITANLIKTHGMLE